MRATKSLLAASGITALAVAAPIALAASGGSTPTLKLTKESLGKILTANGDTMYIYSRDSANDDDCAASCKAVWHPLYTSGKPKAGTGVKPSLIGTTKVGSKLQATYNKHPLYIYSASPTGDGYADVFASGGYWDVLNAAGNAVN